MRCGARDSVIRQLEPVQRQAVRVVCKKIKYDIHIISVTEFLNFCFKRRFIEINKTIYRIVDIKDIRKGIQIESKEI